MKRLTHIALCLCLGLVLLGCGSANTKAQITPNALAMQIKQGSAPLILDVRTAEEYAEGHIPGAVNIEYRQIPDQVKALQNFQNQTVVVYCERGVRAGRAETSLLEAGFTAVIQLRGDISAWREADLPIEVNSPNLGDQKPPSRL